MTITTSKGQTFEVMWCWGPLSDGTLMLALYDPRPLWEVARDLDGLTRIDRKSELEGDATYEGYVELVAIVRDVFASKTTVTLRKHNQKPEAA